MDENVMIAPWFVLAESIEKCWSCQADTKVHAIVLPEIVNIGTGQANSECTISEEAPCALINIGKINDRAEIFLKNLSAQFFPDYSRTASQTYWMNHCEHCSTKIGDFYLHKPSHAFFPLSDDEESKITFNRVDIAIEADAGWSQSSWIDDALRKAGF